MKHFAKLADVQEHHNELKMVKEDIRDAMKAGVRSTPTLFINGRKLRGVPKPWVLDEILQYSEKNLPSP